MRTLPSLLAIACLLLGATARAEDDDPDREIAMRRFQAGAEHYEARRYPDALREFEAARRAKKLPAFDYNIARCLDRLERWQEAVDVYQRYVDAKPEPDDAGEVRKRIAVLRERLGQPPAAPQPAVASPAAPAPPTPAPSPAPSTPSPTVPPLVPAGTPTLEVNAGSRALFGAGIALAAAAVASLGTGLGLYGWVSGNLSECVDAGGCAKAKVDGWRPAGYAGYALIGLGAALAAVDIGLWIYHAVSRKKDRASAWIAPAPGGLTVGGSF